MLFHSPLTTLEVKNNTSIPINQKSSYIILLSHLHQISASIVRILSFQISKHLRLRFHRCAQHTCRRLPRGAQQGFGRVQGLRDARALGLGTTGETQIHGAQEDLQNT